MKKGCLIGLESVDPSLRNCVLTIGNFDGVHLGHRKILKTAAALGEVEQRAIVVLTFEPPPDLVLRPSDKAQRISPPEEKCRLLREAGADYVVMAQANRLLLASSPEDFLEDVILKLFAPGHIVEGRNFFFGRGRSGNIETLYKASEDDGFVLHIVDPLMLDFDGGLQRVSSTFIRQLVSEGRIEDTNRCLGRAFALFGSIVRGTGRGSELGFPTVNINIGQQVSPADGVYAGKARIDGEEYPAAISIGTRPTFGPASGAIEAHLIGAEGDYYGKGIALSFASRLRDQERFENTDALRAQIIKDVKLVREICR